MNDKRRLAGIVATVAVLLSACRGGPAPIAPSATPNANLPNPAAVYCEENGGTVDIRTDDTGAQAGVCVFPDTSECDEWAYYRGDCQPGDSLLPGRPTPGGATNLPNPASVYCEDQGGTVDIRTDASGGQYGMCVFPDGEECDEWAFFRGECGAGKAVTAVAADGWNIYHNAALGYSFHYPADASLDNADEPLNSLTITGPLAGSDHWPMIFLSHPTDREEYRPPEGTDLEAWLVEHRLLPPANQQPAAEVRQPEAEIAGTTAIHTRFERSPQSYAYDKYFFAHAGQLYSVVIVHAGDKEDWEVYNHFLESFQFEG